MGYVIAAISDTLIFRPPAKRHGLLFQGGQSAFGKLEFHLNLVLVFVLLFFIHAVEMSGDSYGFGPQALNRQPKNEELRAGIIANGIVMYLSSLLQLFCNSEPSSQKAPASLLLTKVCNRWDMGWGAITLTAAASRPKLASVLPTIPSCVIGGATILAFSMICMSGMSLRREFEILPTGQ